MSGKSSGRSRARGVPGAAPLTSEPESAAPAGQVAQDGRILPGPPCNLPRLERPQRSVSPGGARGDRAILCASKPFAHGGDAAQAVACALQYTRPARPRGRRGSADDRCSERAPRQFEPRRLGPVLMVLDRFDLRPSVVQNGSPRFTGGVKSPRRLPDPGERAPTVTTRPEDQRPHRRSEPDVAASFFGGDLDPRLRSPNHEPEDDRHLRDLERQRDL